MYPTIRTSAGTGTSSAAQPTFHSREVESTDGQLHAIKGLAHVLQLWATLAAQATQRVTMQVAICPSTLRSAAPAPVQHRGRPMSQHTSPQHTPLSFSASGTSQQSPHHQPKTTHTRQQTGTKLTMSKPSQKPSLNTASVSGLTRFWSGRTTNFGLRRWAAAPATVDLALRVGL
jgi:hypothetical protein